MLFFTFINVKMPTIAGILTFMSRKKSCSLELSMKKVLYPRGLVCAKVIRGTVVLSPVHRGRRVESSSQRKHMPGLILRGLLSRNVETSLR